MCEEPTEARAANWKKGDRMTTLVLSFAQLFGTALGMAVIWRLSRSAMPDRLVFAIAAILSGLMALFVFAISEPSHLFEDFTDAYLAAGQAVLSGPEALRPEIELGAHGFVNLPIVAYLFTPFALLPDHMASLAFLLAGIGAMLGAWWLICRHFRFDRTVSALSLFVMSSFGPMLYSVREGNTSHILLLALIGGLVLSRSRRDYLAGIVFAAAAIIKPPLLLIGIYFALRQRWRVVAGGLGMCVGTLALSLLVFGWDMHALWIANFREYAGAPMPGFNTQSLAAATLRFMLGPDSYLDWEPHALPGLARSVILGLTLILLAIGVWASRRAGDADDREDMHISLLLAFICIASTVSWSHYYTWLIPAFALVYSRLKNEDLLTWPVISALAAFILAMPAERIGHAETGRLPDIIAGVASSHLLWAGLLLYGLLIWLAAGSLASRRNRTSTPSAEK
jgi:alpha-1,2-mannosyltransferase